MLMDPVALPELVRARAVCGCSGLSRGMCRWLWLNW